MPKKKQKIQIHRKTIKSAQKGDIKAFEQIVRLYEQKVLALACNIVSSPVDAKDVAQEVFIRLYKYLPGFRFQNKFYSWLYRIVVNASYDWIREKHRFIELPIENIPESQYAVQGEITFDNFDFEEKIEECLSRINHVHKTAFILKEIEGFSCREIANILECPQGTVRSHLYYARKSLQRELLQHYPELAGKKKEKLPNAV